MEQHLNDAALSVEAGREEGFGVVIWSPFLLAVAFSLPHPDAPKHARRHLKENPREPYSE